MTSTKETPAHAADMGARCEFCAGRSFRRSHLQVKDLLPLLIFHYPVRCLSCSKRQSVSLFVAKRALPSTVKQVRSPWTETPWSGWNSSDQDARGTISGGPGERSGGPGERHFSALPVRAPVAMPELKGVTLRHVDAATNDEKLV